jgi:uncharacterized protein
MQTALPTTSLSPSLVLSIHDVSTVTWKRVGRMLQELAEVGVPLTSLLVIPDHHRKGRIDADFEFSSWLKEVVGQGHEAVLHGFYHLRPVKNGENLATRLITRFYTAGEGEFYDLSFEQASALLREGRDALRRCGETPEGAALLGSDIQKPDGSQLRKPDGFIAPAWLLGAEAERAVRDEGFGYTTRIGTVIDCREGREYAARSMVYSVRAGWRRTLSLIWNEALFHALKKAPLLRIGLHPPDWDHEPIRRHILKCVKLAVRDRQVTTYREWIAAKRLDQKQSSVH